MNPKYSKRIQKNPKNPKEYERFQTIQKIQKDFNSIALNGKKAANQKKKFIFFQHCPSAKLVTSFCFVIFKLNN